MLMMNHVTRLSISQYIHYASGKTWMQTSLLLMPSTFTFAACLPPYISPHQYSATAAIDIAFQKPHLHPRIQNIETPNMNTYLHFKLKQLNFYLHEVAKKTSLKLNRIVFGLIVFFFFFFHFLARKFKNSNI